jgi:hypothetical protein
MCAPRFQRSKASFTSLNVKVALHTVKRLVFILYVHPCDSRSRAAPGPAPWRSQWHYFPAGTGSAFESGSVLRVRGFLALNGVPPT